MSDLATRIVDAIFDQWQADCGLTKAKAIERVQSVVSGYMVNKLPDGHAYTPICDIDPMGVVVGVAMTHTPLPYTQDFTKPFKPYDDTNRRF